jgi:hypothetical protein
MNKEKAISIVIDALSASTKAGVFSLQDCASIIQAINKINELVEIIPTED